MFEIKKFSDAQNVEELLVILSEDENAKVIAGGTDLLVDLRNRRQLNPELHLVSIQNIKIFKKIDMDESGTISIGPMNTFTETAKHPVIKKYLPLLAYAVTTVGGPQTRNAGTIGGNVCNGATSADSAPALFAYNATLEIESLKGKRNIPIQEFYLGPGKVALEKGEVLTSIKITKENYSGMIGHYTKFAQRNALDIANLSCATLFKESDGQLTDMRIAFGVAGPTPIRAIQAEKFAEGKVFSEELLNLIGEKCVLDSKARDSWRASKQYREHLIRLLPGRNIEYARRVNRYA